ncbi:hypothetical protein FKM82_026612 [Ascaphus truei]
MSFIGLVPLSREWFDVSVSPCPTLSLTLVSLLAHGDFFFHKNFRWCEKPPACSPGPLSYIRYFSSVIRMGFRAIFLPPRYRLRQLPNRW